MRVGANLLLYNGYCYQSYGWKLFRPLGELQLAIDILDRYEVDEISILRPIRSDFSNEHFEADLELLSELKTLTPTSFGGGIRAAQNIMALSDLPIERIIMSSPFIKQDSELIDLATSLYGGQAIVACLPFRLKNNSVEVFHSAKNCFINVDDGILKFVIEHADEVVLYDTENEGKENHFQLRVLDLLNIPAQKVIISGGVGKGTISYARELKISSAIIENRVLHRENSIEYFK